MFLFWLKFISESQDQIVLERTQGLLDYIEEELPRFLGPIFEKASKQWLWQQDDLPFEPRKIGSWWGNNPMKHRQEEIDVVAINFDNSQAIVGECKWRNIDKINHEIIDTLNMRAMLLPKVKRTFKYVFVKESKKDFEEYAAKNNVKVVRYTDFFNE